MAPESQLIVAAAVRSGNPADPAKALEVVEQAEKKAPGAVEETMGDGAFGDGMPRQEFADAKRTLRAKGPPRRAQTFFPQDDFPSDLQTMTCTCPAGPPPPAGISISSGKRYGAPAAPLGAFRFAPALCAVGALRPSCGRARLGRGRVVMLPPREALLQEARAFQKRPAFAPYRKLRQVAEQRLARLRQLGMRQARSWGRQKTRFHLFRAATVAKLPLVGPKLGLIGKEGNRNHFPLVLF